MSEVKIGAQASLLALSAGREQPFEIWLLSIKQAVCRLSTAWQARDAYAPVSRFLVKLTIF